MRLTRVEKSIIQATSNRGQKMNHSKTLTFFAIGILSLTSCGPSKRHEAIKATQEKIVNNKDYVSDTGNLSLIYDYDKEAGFLVKVYLKTYDIEENDRFDLHVDIDADGGIQSKMDLMFYDGVKNVEGNMYIYASSISSIWIYAIEFTIKDSYTLGSSEYTVRGETNEYPNALSSSTAYKLLNSMLKLGISSFSDFCRENALSVEVFFPNVA